MERNGSDLLTLSVNYVNNEIVFGLEYAGNTANYYI